MAADYAQYAIDIAAQMTGGEYTAAQLDTLTAKLSGGGKGAEYFQRAMQQVASELDVARTASASANTALGEGAAQFKGLELAALQLVKAQEKAARESAKLAGLLAQASAKGAADDVAALSVRLAGAQEDEARLARELRATTAALDAQGASMKGLESSAAAATAKEKALAAQLGNVKTISTHVDRSLLGNSESLSKVQGALGQIGGPLGRLGQLAVAPAKGFADLKVSLGAGNAAMLVAAAGAAILVAAVIALSVAIVAGLVGIAKWGVGLADARREAELTAEAGNAMNPALGAASSTFAELTRETGQTSAQLSTLAKSLLDAKVAADDMPAALRAAATAETALGQGGAAEFVAKLKAGKLTVQDFANTVESKFGGIVARQMLGLGMQLAQLKRDFVELFSGLQIDRVLAGMQTIVGIFDKTGASGRALEFYFTKIFQPLIDNAEAAAYVVEAFVLGFLIGVTKLYLAAKPAIQAVAELLGFRDTKLSDGLTLAKYAGEALAVVLVSSAVMFTAVATVVGVVVGAILAWNAAVFAAVAIAVIFAAKLTVGVVGFFRELPTHVSNAIAAVVNFFATLPATLAAVDWNAVGVNLVDGIANGITSMIGAVIGAAQALAAGVVGMVAAIPQSFAAMIAGVVALAGNVAQWVSIGANIVAGIARGIAGAAGAVLSAIGGVVSGAVGRAKQLLGIASPSKVFTEIGDYTGEGFVEGIDNQQKAADAAMGALVEPPAPSLAKYDALSGNLGAPVQAAPAAAQAAQAAGPTTSATFAGATFNFYGVEGAEDAELRFGECMTRILEGDAASLGVAA
jgi:hypothetical protein